jgi:nicotinate-nucleotide adenylyltransferase
MKIGFLGGTFDPIHIGHLWTARQVQEKMNFDHMYIVPNYSSASTHWDKSVSASDEDRLVMCNLSILRFEELKVNSIEINNKFQYTYQTMKWYKDNFPNSELTWIIGSDWKTIKTKFKNFAELNKICKFINIQRPGFNSKYENIKLDVSFDISSTTIRKRIMKKQSISGLVTPEVESYILAKGLYI